MYDVNYIKNKLNNEILIDILDEIDSTNEEAKRRIANGQKEDFVLVARMQTAGKGRKGRCFYSPLDTGIYLTYTHFTEESIEASLKTTVATSVIVKNSIKEATGLDCGIKWVNDLYLNGKKVCGILCECILKNTYDNDKNALIIGIGINLTTSDYPEELSNKAGPVISYNDTVVSSEHVLFFEDISQDIRNDIVSYIIDGLYLFFSDKDYDFIDDYRNSSIVLGKRVELSDASGIYAKGFVKDILDNGELLLLDENNQEKVIDSGEISLIVL